MFRQASLFPDAFEVVDQALRALDRLDVEEAWRWVEEARRRDPGLVELAPMRACIAWLRAQLGGPLTDERLAELFVQVSEEVRAGRVDRSTAARIDELLARQGLARAGAGAFIDRAERVHRGALFLVLGRPGEAHDLLRESLASGAEDRADLWGYHGDACLGTERPEEANAAYVRALLLGAREVDLHRLRNERLRVLLDELRADHPEPEARERLLVHAWLRGALAIPTENCWVEPHLSRLQLASLHPVSPDPARTAHGVSSAAERLRRFALLLYLDRSRPPGVWDEAEREEMQALEPELFALVIQRFRALERSPSRPLRWS